MLRKILTIALPVAAAAAAFTFFPARPAQALASHCEQNWETCMARATTPMQSSFCDKAYMQCTGGAMPPHAIDPLLGNRKHH